jgi:hypothetical protein
LKQTQIADDAHPCPNISKTPVGGNVAGLMITVCIVVIALVGIPASRWFLGASLALGAVVALVLRLTASHRG